LVGPIVLRSPAQEHYSYLFGKEKEKEFVLRVSLEKLRKV